MEELTREEAIRRHRLMWNWLADEIEKTGKQKTKKEAFEHFGWNYQDIYASCWCCEYAGRLWRKDETDEEKLICDFCPLDWSVGENIIGATCTSIPGNFTIIGGIKPDWPGLYRLWVHYSSQLVSDYEPDIEKAVILARTIANLPEKKEVQDND